MTRPPSWIETKAQLQARVDAGGPAPQDVTELALKSIEAVFQHRSGNQASSGKHIDVLAKTLKGRKDTSLDPLMVFWAGDGWVMVDGHHRYKAYEATERAAPVPVKVFFGSLDQDISEALRGNSGDKLAMGSREKSEAA